MASVRDVGVVVVVMLLGARCSPGPTPVDPSAECSAACENLRTLGCEEGDPTADGSPCEEVCDNGMAGRYDLSCVAQVVYCDLAACERTQ